MNVKGNFNDRTSQTVGRYTYRYMYRQIIGNATTNELHQSVLIGCCLGTNKRSSAPDQQPKNQKRCDLGFVWDPPSRTCDSQPDGPIRPISCTHLSTTLHKDGGPVTKGPNAWRQDGSPHFYCMCHSDGNTLDGKRSQLIMRLWPASLGEIPRLFTILKGPTQASSGAVPLAASLATYLVSL